MSVRMIILLLVLLCIAVFTAVNWEAFVAPTTLSLLVTTVEAPLGLIMLAIVILLTALFIAYGIYLQTSVLLEARQHARELKTQRDLANQAEASRFTALQGFLEGELKKIQEQSFRSQADLLARLEQVERELRSSVEQAGNTLAAYIGELDERLKQEEPKQEGEPRPDTIPGEA